MQAGMPNAVTDYRAPNSLARGKAVQTLGATMPSVHPVFPDVCIHSSDQGSFTFRFASPESRLGYVCMYHLGPPQTQSPCVSIDRPKVRQLSSVTLPQANVCATRVVQLKCNVELSVVEAPPTPVQIAVRHVCMDLNMCTSLCRGPATSSSSDSELEPELEPFARERRTVRRDGQLLR